METPIPINEHLSSVQNPCVLPLYTGWFRTGFPCSIIPELIINQQGVLNTAHFFQESQLPSPADSGGWLCRLFFGRYTFW